MARLETLQNRVLDELPSVPLALALRALSDAAKEFFTRTHAWQDYLAATQVREGEPLVELALDQGTQLVSIKSVWLADRRLLPQPVELQDLRTHKLSPGVPIAFTQTSPATITLHRTPPEDAVLVVRAALTLALGHTTLNLPDDLIDEHGEALAHGAKMRLQRQSNQPWEDRVSSQTHAALFYAHVTQTKVRVASALGAAEMRVVPRTW